MTIPADDSTNSITFIVPAYNEAEAVADTVDTIIKAITGRWDDYEIILVNDASQDDTGSIIDRLAAGNDRVKALHNAKNMNLGGTYKHGLSKASKAYAMMVPGDNSFDADSIRTILSNIGKADIILPYVVNTEVRTRFRAFASSAFTYLMNFLFGFTINYYNGPSVHRVRLLRQIEINTNSFAYQAEAVIKVLAKGNSFHECPIRLQERTTGRSSALKMKNQVAILTTIARLLLSVGPRCLFAKPKAH
ncbi:hypothetical protein A6A04_03950 [Paramagnetospirillum marisnigri]|uniref:Glycosyltransferase 2-like domain-containing protein n=1 Tax=Paramagnetospirillum marisnigri TaxID=1285242 RepID=A0A178MMG6_9PROT|nr:glycosyltransferase family 2 protein [Paramagnetospirillum marisnigri]OAN49278.1 hypothetical protein A6A04_03950 [Paramagnetospirillum marisnigri]